MCEDEGEGVATHLVVLLIYSLNLFVVVVPWALVYPVSRWVGGAYSDGIMGWHYTCWCCW